MRLTRTQAIELYENNFGDTNADMEVIVEFAESQGYEVKITDAKIVSHETLLKGDILQTLKRQYKRYQQEQERNHRMTLNAQTTEYRNLYHQATLESVISKNTVYETAILLGFTKEELEND